MLQPGDLVTPIPWDELTILFPTVIDDDGILRVHIPSADLSFEQCELDPFEGAILEVKEVDYDGEVIFTEDTYIEYDEPELSNMFYVEEMLRNINDGTDEVSDRDEPVDIPSFFAVLNL